MSTASRGTDFEQVKQRIHAKLIGKLDLSRVGNLEGDVLKREIRLVIEQLCELEENLMNRTERDRLVEEIMDETLGLGPLEFLLKDPTISDILINGPKTSTANVVARWKRRKSNFATTTTCFRSLTELFPKLVVV